MEIAISDSVTVSIGDETRGAFRVIVLLSAEVRSCKYKTPLSALSLKTTETDHTTSSAVKSMKPGRIMKSLCEKRNEQNNETEI